MQLIPGEGAWFAVTYKSQEAIDGEAASHVTGPHYGYSAIFALETKVDFSAMHKLVTDEMWHFYGGVPGRDAPPLSRRARRDGHHRSRCTRRPTPTVPRAPGRVAGLTPALGGGADAYSFFGTTLTPGFEYADYEQGYRDDLQAKYPAFASKIAELTRVEFASRPSSVHETAPSPPAPAPGDCREDRSRPQRPCQRGVLPAPARGSLSAQLQPSRERKSSSSRVATGPSSGMESAYR
jgi:predicted cupin superfamily sugar epimerase